MIRSKSKNVESFKDLSNHHSSKIKITSWFWAWKTRCLSDQFSRQPYVGKQISWFYNWCFGSFWNPFLIHLDQILHHLKCRYTRCISTHSPSYSSHSRVTFKTITDTSTAISRLAGLLPTDVPRGQNLWTLRIHRWMITDGFDQPSRGHQGLSKRPGPIASLPWTSSLNHPVSLNFLGKNMGFSPIPKSSFGMKTLRESCELTIKGGVTSRKKYHFWIILDPSSPLQNCQNRFKLPSVWQLTSSQLQMYQHSLMVFV